MARLLVEIEESLKRDLKVRLMREGETLKEWISRMAQYYVDGEIPPAFIAEKREVREPQSGKVLTPAPKPIAPTKPAAPQPPKKDDIFFFD